MSDDESIPSLAEAMAEIRRLRGEAATMRHASGEARLSTYVPPEYVSVPRAQYVDMTCELDRLRAKVKRLELRVDELEGAHAVNFGTLEQPTPDEPATYRHNVPPSAPPHNE